MGIHFDGAKNCINFKSADNDDDGAPQVKLLFIWREDAALNLRT
jgi:hypothetical protein